MNFQFIVFILTKDITNENLATCLKAIESQSLTVMSLRCNGELPVPLMAMTIFISRMMDSTGIKAKVKLTEQYAAWILTDINQGRKLAELVAQLVEKHKINIKKSILF